MDLDATSRISVNVAVAGLDLSTATSQATLLLASGVDLQLSTPTAPLLRSSSNLVVNETIGRHNHYLIVGDD